MVAWFYSWLPDMWCLLSVYRTWWTCASGPSRWCLAKKHFSKDIIVCLASSTNIFLDCAIAASVWTLVRSWLGIFSVAPNLFDNTLFSFLPWRVWRDLHTFSLKLFGSLVFGFFGRRWITVSSKILLLILVFSLTKWSFTHFYGWNRIRCRLRTVITTGGNTRFFVWESTCNFILLF